MQWSINWKKRMERKRRNLFLFLSYHWTKLYTPSYTHTYTHTKTTSTDKQATEKRKITEERKRAKDIVLKILLRWNIHSVLYMISAILIVYEITTDTSKKFQPPPPLPPPPPAPSRVCPFSLSSSFVRRLSSASS